MVSPESGPGTVSRADVASVAVTGDLDVCTVGVLQRQITRALGHQPRLLVIDLTGVTFVSAAGVSLLIRTRAFASAQDCRVEFRGTNRPVIGFLFRVLGFPEYQPRDPA